MTVARILDMRLQGVLATNEREFDAVFNTLRRSGAGALVICEERAARRAYASRRLPRF